VDSHGTGIGRAPDLVPALQIQYLDNKAHPATGAVNSKVLLHWSNLIALYLQKSRILWDWPSVAHVHGVLLDIGNCRLQLRTSLAYVKKGIPAHWTSNITTAPKGNGRHWATFGEPVKVCQNLPFYQDSSVPGKKRRNCIHSPPF